MAYFLDARPDSLLVLDEDCLFSKIADVYRENKQLEKTNLQEAVPSTFQNKSNETYSKPEKFGEIIDFER